MKFCKDCAYYQPHECYEGNRCGYAYYLWCVNTQRGKIKILRTCNGNNAKYNCIKFKQGNLLSSIRNRYLGWIMTLLSIPIIYLSFNFLYNYILVNVPLREDRLGMSGIFTMLLAYPAVGFGVCYAIKLIYQWYFYDTEYGGEFKEKYGEEVNIEKKKNTLSIFLKKVCVLVVFSYKYVIGFLRVSVESLLKF
jgi:hypothetical protein